MPEDQVGSGVPNSELGDHVLTAIHALSQFVNKSEDPDFRATYGYFHDSFDCRQRCLRALRDAYHDSLRQLLTESLDCIGSIDASFDFESYLASPASWVG